MAAPSPNSGFTTTLRRYAWVGALLGLLLLAGGGLLYLINPAWAFQSQLAVGGGGTLLMAAILLRPDVVRRALTGRPARYASNAAVMSLAFIGILGFINYLALKNNREYDLTETGQFTLSEQTISILQNMDEPVQVIGFFQSIDPRLNRAKDYLERYSAYTGHLSYEFHDPNIEPALAQSFELQNYGLVFVSTRGQYETAQVDEQSITTGLMRVTREEQPAIYFITGHGEHSLSDQGPEGYSSVQEALLHENYQVQPLNLSAAGGGIPTEAGVLVLSGADRPLSDLEKELITAWIPGKGLMILADPFEPAPLETLLADFGLTLQDNFVVEDPNHALVTLDPDQGLTPQQVAPMIVRYPYHEITRHLNGFQSFYPFARSILIQETSAAKAIFPLLTTSENSWAETELDTTNPEYTPSTDTPGPLHIGVAAENIEQEARLVLIGNAGFVTNQNVSPQVANMDLFINAVDWLAEEEELISIRPKAAANRQLFVTSLQVSLIFVTSLVIIPLAVFAAGVGAWWRRR